MYSIVSQNNESFTLKPSGLGAMVDAARTMAEINRRWGCSTPVSLADLEQQLENAILEAKRDSQVSSEEIDAMENNKALLISLEELANIFREIEDEDDDLLPQFEGDREKAIDTLTLYMNSVGCSFGAHGD